MLPVIFQCPNPHVCHLCLAVQAVTEKQNHAVPAMGPPWHWVSLYPQGGTILAHPSHPIHPIPAGMSGSRALQDPGVGCVPLGGHCPCRAPWKEGD